METILRRGTFNTRPRDFYDVYILTKTQNFEPSIFAAALRATAARRETTHIFTAISKRVQEIKNDETLKSRWITYSKNYPYAEGITYDEVMHALYVLIEYV